MSDWVSTKPGNWCVILNGRQYIWQPKKLVLHCEGKEDRDCASVHEAEDKIREETGYTGNIFWY